MAAGREEEPALTVDPMGNAHVVYVHKARIPKEWKSEQLNGTYWQLRYERR